MGTLELEVDWEKYCLRLLHQALDTHSASDVKSLWEFGTERNGGDTTWFQKWLQEIVLKGLCFKLDLSDDNADKDKEILCVLLQASTDTDKRNALLLHILSEALSAHNATAVDYLLELGAKLNHSDQNWLDGLDVSSIRIAFSDIIEHKEILQALLKALPNKDKQNALLLDLLREAVSLPLLPDDSDLYWQTQVVKYLIGLGVDFSLDDRKKKDILCEWVSSHDLCCGSVTNEDIEIIKAMLIAHACPDRPDDNGDTALHFAAELGSIELMRTLVHHGADINKENKDGFNPVVYGFHNGKDFIEEMYRARGIMDFSYRNSKGENYVMLFLKHENSLGASETPKVALWLVKFAAEHGLDIEDATNDGKTVFDYLPRHNSGILKNGYPAVKKALNVIKKLQTEDKRKDTDDPIDPFGF